MVYVSVAIPCALVIAVPIGVPFILNCMVLPGSGMLLCVSVSVAIRLIVSPLNPFTGFTVIAVGVLLTVRVFVLLLAVYVVSSRNCASIV